MAKTREVRAMREATTVRTMQVARISGGNKNVKPSRKILEIQKVLTAHIEVN